MTHNYSAKDNTFMHCCLKENKNISYDFDFKKLLIASFTNFLVHTLYIQQNFLELKPNVGK